MARTKITSIQLPRGINKPDVIREVSKHFDSVNTILAEEHYGKYIIVKNSKSQNIKHNRKYICFHSLIEFMSIDNVNKGLVKSQKKRGIADAFLLSRFPKHYNFIQDTIFALIEPFSLRAEVGQILRGFGFFLSILNDNSWTTLEEINESHLQRIEQDAKENNYTKSILAECSIFLRKTMEHYGKSLKIPEYIKYGSDKKVETGELSLGVSWQCDVYACKELDETMKLVNEHKEWMNRLAEMQEPFSEEELIRHGGLFTLKNLLFTYFDNINRVGKKKASTINRVIQRAAQSLYGLDLKVLEHKQDSYSEKRKEEDELHNKAKGGTNITVRDEQMFAIWHKVISPKYPFVDDFLHQYAFVQKHLRQWRNEIAKRTKFSLEVFDRRIYPDGHVVYPLYLLSLCRTGLNQQPVKEWHVWKDEQGKYHLGEDSGMGRIVDGFKGRGNTMQSTALDRKHCKYVDFWCEYAKPLFEDCNDNHFFQYIETKNKRKNRVQPSIFEHQTIKSMYSGKSHFFYRNNITDIIYQTDGTSKEERVYSIQHEKIRKIKNLSEYLEGKVQWERQFGLGHKNAKTEVIYQQTVAFKGSKQHRINRTMNDFLAFLKGKLTAEQNHKFKIFNGPLANCNNPFKPTYIGAQKLRDGDICMNWRKCLTECDKCEPVKHIHAPNILAWKDVMDELRLAYNSEEWDRMYLLDYMAAEAAEETFKFTEEEKVIYQTRAKEFGRLAFIRKEVLNSHRSRRLSKEEKDNA